MGHKILHGGKLVNSPMVGIEAYDMKKLSLPQAEQMSRVLDKGRSGAPMSMSELEGLLPARRAAKVAAGTTLTKTGNHTIDQLSNAVANLNRVFKS